MPELEEQQTGHRLTLGGITLESDSGKCAYFESICQYSGLTDEQLQKLWHHFQDKNRPGAQKIQKLADDLRDAVLEDMTVFGDLEQGVDVSRDRRRD